MPIVAEEDPSRNFLPSSPSNGPKTKEEGWISQNPQDNLYGDGEFDILVKYYMKIHFRMSIVLSSSHAYFTWQETF